MASTITSPLNISSEDLELPTLKVSIPRNSIIKELVYEETEFTITPYAESQIPINVASGFIELPQSFVSPITKIIIIAPVDPGSPLPVVTTLKLYTENGSANSEIELPLQNIFIFCPGADFASTIKKVYIATTSIPTVNVQVRIYGE